MLISEMIHHSIIPVLINFISVIYLVVLLVFYIFIVFLYTFLLLTIFCWRPINGTL